MNKPALLEELERLTSRERLELAYGLLDSVLHDATAPPLNDAQRDELKARIAHHRAPGCARRYAGRHPPETDRWLESLPQN